MSKLIIFVVILVIIIAIVAFIIVRKLKGNKIDKTLEENKESFAQILEFEELIQKELRRCEKISKNDKTIELLNNWKKEYRVIEEYFTKAKEHLQVLEGLADEVDIKNFFRESENFLAYLDSIEPFVNSYYEKLKNYTTYEIDNTQMALNLKERLKELTNIFDQKLKMIDVYNSSFVEETTKIKILIKKFEEEQKRGNYPRARLVLKDCNDSLVLLESNISVIVNYYDVMYSAEEKINKFKRMKNLLAEKGLSKYEKLIELRYNENQQKREDLIESVKKIKFTDIETLEISLNEVKYFDENLESYIHEAEESFNKIEGIFAIIQKNEEEIKFINELLKGAIEEKEKIEKLYSLQELSHFDNILEESRKFEQFKMDYAELNNLFVREIKDFDIHNEKFIQSNRYLRRVLSNVRLVIEGLEAIRSDELEIIEKVEKYKVELVNINLYLRNNYHLDKLNGSLESMYEEISHKINVLEFELQKEPLDIGNVRMHNDIIEKLLRTLIFDIERDIKQRKGVEKLILYYNRFIVEYEHLEYYKHFLSLYNSKEYMQILKDIHSSFIDMDNRGDELYKSIVSTIKIDEYKSQI